MDTVFSTVASSTYQLKVFNPTDEAVVVDNIRLNNTDGCINLNINGTASNSLDDVEILPKDSIYIFVEMANRANCLANDSSSFIRTDQIIFQNKDVRQSVDVETFIRDAYFHYPTNYLTVGNTLIPYSVISCNSSWIGDKPHVVYGYAVVDSGCVLDIQAGAEVYFHQGSGLWVFNGGSLKVAENASPGTGDSVIFSSDRLEPFYEDVPGQWGGVLGGIFIQGGSLDNVINNAVIKNATTAVRLDSSSTLNFEISNSYILNNSRIGIYGGYGNMTAENLVVANAGVHLLYAFGGNYEFRHATFANYWSGSSRNTAGVAVANYLDTYNPDGDPIRIVRDVEKAYFGNCIITGNNREELAILNDDAGSINYTFNNLLLKHDEEEDDKLFDVNDPAYFSQVRVNADPAFRNPADNNYRLDSNSQAINQGNAIDGSFMPTDIKGDSRNFNGQADLGAFEYIPD